MFQLVARIPRLAVGTPGLLRVNKQKHLLEKFTDYKNLKHFVQNYHFEMFQQVEMHQLQHSKFQKEKFNWKQTRNIKFQISHKIETCFAACTPICLE